MKKIAYLHGLEAKAGGVKYDYLKEQYKVSFAAQIDYWEDDIFEKIFLQLKSKKLDLIIGSSMGGFFAYHLAKKLNVPTVLFNPALLLSYIDEYKGVDLTKIDQSGTKTPFHNVVLGKNDEVIPPHTTIAFLEKEEESHHKIIMEYHAHRTPVETFKKHV